MNAKLMALSVCGSLIPNFYRPPAGVLFPYAHIVTDAAPSHVRHLYNVQNVAKFKADVDFFCRHFEPLSLLELGKIAQRRNSRASARYFVFSFDDGMREIYDVIAPILREKGIPAVFFLNSAMIDNRRLMWRHKVSLLVERCLQQPGLVPPQIDLAADESLPEKLKSLRYHEESILDDVACFFGLDFDDYLRTRKPYLTTDQVLELAREGFEFGGHSVSHPYFNQIPLEAQKRQITGCVNFIRELGLPCRCFAFPFHDGGVPASVFGYMSELGLVLSFGTSEARLDSIDFSFQRIALDAEHTDLNPGDLMNELSVKSLVRRVSGTEVIRRHDVS